MFCVDALCFLRTLSAPNTSIDAFAFGHFNSILQLKHNCGLFFFIDLLGLTCDYLEPLQTASYGFRQIIDLQNRGGVTNGDSNLILNEPKRLVTETKIIVSILLF